MKIANRLAALEIQAAPPAGTWHQIIVRQGQTKDEAIDEYGREKVSTEASFIIFRVILPPPKRDVARRPRTRQPSRSHMER